MESDAIGETGVPAWVVGHAIEAAAKCAGGPMEMSASPTESALAVIDAYRAVSAATGFTKQIDDAAADAARVKDALLQYAVGLLPPPPVLCAQPGLAVPPEAVADLLNLLTQVSQQADSRPPSLSTGA